MSTDRIAYGELVEFVPGPLGVPKLTRPQDHYSIRIAFQDPGAVKVDQPYDPEIFVLKNASNLPEVNLDAKKP